MKKRDLLDSMSLIDEKYIIAAGRTENRFEGVKKQLGLDSMLCRMCRTVRRNRARSILHE